MRRLLCSWSLRGQTTHWGSWAWRTQHPTDQQVDSSRGRHPVTLEIGNPGRTVTDRWQACSDVGPLIAAVLRELQQTCGKQQWCDSRSRDAGMGVVEGAEGSTAAIAQWSRQGRHAQQVMGLSSSVMWASLRVAGSAAQPVELHHRPLGAASGH